MTVVLHRRLAVLQRTISAFVLSSTSCADTSNKSHAVGIVMPKASAVRQVVILPGHPLQFEWLDRGHIRHQAVDLPGVWRFPTYLATAYTPYVTAWRGALREAAIVIVAERPSGVYGFRAPVVYRLRHERWALVTPHPEELAFSDRGGFHICGRRMSVWDFADDPRYAHRAPQPYVLKVFEYTEGGLKWIRTERTKRRYPEIDGNDPPRRVPVAYDPLREFGRTWRWWGE